MYHIERIRKELLSSGKYDPLMSFYRDSFPRWKMLVASINFLMWNEQLELVATNQSQNFLLFPIRSAITRNHPENLGNILFFQEFPRLNQYFVGIWKLSIMIHYCSNLPLLFVLIFSVFC